jgi:pyridoxamine 5'-phosphate oxidase
MVDHDVPLREEDVSSDPLEQFRRWYEEAARVLRMPEAAAVATADTAGRPSVRMVLVKQVDERGFTFFTSYESRKGRELLARPCAALLFYWDLLGRQVRVEGPVEQVSTEESDAYFASRPRGSQLSASASCQSSPVASRAALEARVAEVTLALGEGAVPRPPQWGGFRLRPLSYEFWQNRDDRLHDRLQFELGQVELGQVELGQVELGQVELGLGTDLRDPTRTPAPAWTVRRLQP